MQFALGKRRKFKVSETARPLQNALRQGGNAMFRQRMQAEGTGPEAKFYVVIWKWA